MEKAGNNCSLEKVKVNTRCGARGDTYQLCYAFGYFAAACRGEIEPVLSLQKIRDWLETRLTPEQIAAGMVTRLSKQIYGHLERLAVRGS